jgi:hypothetical protein
LKSGGLPKFVLQSRAFSAALYFHTEIRFRESLENGCFLGVLLRQFRDQLASAETDCTGMAFDGSNPIALASQSGLCVLAVRSRKEPRRCGAFEISGQSLASENGPNAENFARSFSQSFGIFPNFGEINRRLARTFDCVAWQSGNSI